MMQCDGKAHWQVASFDENDRGVTRINYTVSPLCLTEDNKRVKLAAADDTSIVKCNIPEADLRLGSGIIKNRRETL